MSKHAILAPSDADRWMTCPASIRATQGMEEAPSVYAEEGTRAHTLAYLTAAKHFSQATRGDVTLEDFRSSLDPDELQEMEKHVSHYVRLLESLMGRHIRSQLLLEQVVHPGVPECWGTADAIIVSPSYIHVVDLKYGAGVAVRCEGNAQLRLYALGALEEYGSLLGYAEGVGITICQPRLGNVSTDEMTPEDLRRWRAEEVMPAALLALGPDAPPFNPTLEACRWCPIAGTCRARAEKMAAQDFSRPPDELSPEEIGEALEGVEELRDWLSKLEATALDRVYRQGLSIPGWKVVLSGGRRTIPDPASAIQTLIDAGWTAEQVSRISIRPLGELDRLVGARELKEILGEQIVKSSGREALARSDDPRPSVDLEADAAKDFST